MGLAGREKRGSGQSTSGLPAGGQSDTEEAGKRDGQYVDEVNEAQGKTQMNRNGLVYV